MTLTRAELLLVLDELQPLVRHHAVLQKVRESPPLSHVLRFRIPGQSVLLLLSTSPQRTRMHVVTSRPAQPARPSAFTMLLRKWLQGARLQRLTPETDDRVVRMAFTVADPEADTPADTPRPKRPVSLILELLGRHPNVILLDDQDRVLGRQRRQVLGPRTLDRGQLYKPPPPPPPNTPSTRIRPGLRHATSGTFPRSAFLEVHYRGVQASIGAEQLRSDLQKQLQNHLDRLARRISHIEDDLARADQAQEFKRRAELLQSAWGRVQRGDTCARVPDFYAEDQPMVDIPLDPSRDLQGNIEHYFHAYKRFKNAAERILQRLEDTERTHQHVSDALQRLHTTPGDDLSALRDQLYDDGVIPKPAPAPTRKKDTPRQPYRKFTSSSGANILVGRGPESNDTLSTAIARGRDLWLHARDFSGAHVVLRMAKGQPSPGGDDLIDAATLAAWFSSGRRDSLIDVTHTRAKYVRKPSGVPAGLVTVADGSTIAIRIDQDRLNRLLDTEEAS